MPATKDQIADTFAKHVGRYGYGKATVEDVAAELGISKKTIYEHFDSKRAIYAYIIERIADEWSAQMRGVIEGVDTWGGKFESLLAFVTEGARTHIEETTKSDWDQEYEVVAEGLLQAVRDVMNEVIAGGIAAGEFAVTDPVLTERMLTALSLEYTFIIREDPTVDIDAEYVAAARRFLG